MRRYRYDLALVCIAVLFIAEMMLLARCADRPKPKPVAAATAAPRKVTDTTVGGAVREVSKALRRWDDYVAAHHPCTPFVTSDCVTASARSRVVSALRAYTVAGPSGNLSPRDTTKASVSMVMASHNLVVAVSESIEYHP